MFPKIRIAFALLGFFAGWNASAQTVCYIYLSRPCLVSPSTPPGRYFADGDAYANHNAGRCIERAREYKAWCRTPGLEAASVFQANGINRIGAGTASDGKSYLNDGVARGLNFHD